VSAPAARSANSTTWAKARWLPWRTNVKVIYDPEVDVLRILFNDKAIEESDEEKPGVILDYDIDGNLVGLEVLDASTRIENPRALEYAVTS
jgi:uncharacterized protein YuzE